MKADTAHWVEWRMEVKVKYKTKAKISTTILKEKKKKKTKDMTSIDYKKVWPMHSSQRIIEMVSELEDYRWDAISLSETWREEKSEIWETHHKRKFMGAGEKTHNKQDTEIVLNKKWRIRMIRTNTSTNEPSPSRSW